MSEDKKNPMWVPRPYQEVLKSLGPHNRQDIGDAVREMRIPNPNYKPNQGNPMNKIEQQAADALESVSRIEQDMRLKEATWSAFHDKLFAKNAKPLPFTKENVQALRFIATVTPGFEDQAASQIRKLGSYLVSMNLPGTILAFLVCGVVPPDGPVTDAASFRLFTGEVVLPHNRQVRDAFWLLRKWHRAEENTGLVDWVEFFRWCLENDIDTNYLRLMCELTATGSKHILGELPLKDLVKYGSQF